MTSDIIGYLSFEMMIKQIIKEKQKERETVISNHEVNKYENSGGFVP